MLTIVCSGPQGRVKAVRKALADAGLSLVTEPGGSPTLHSFGRKAAKGECFVSGHGEDVDAAAAAVAPLGWRLRAHWPENADTETTLRSDNLSAADRLARIEADLAILKGQH